MGFGVFVLLGAHHLVCAELRATRVGSAWVGDRVWMHEARASGVLRASVGSTCGRRRARVDQQARGVLALPLAAIVTLPFGWVYGYYQNLSVIGSGPEMSKEARAIARHWPAQNHLGLLFLSVAAIAVWVNCLTSFYVLPWLANRLLGVDNIFGLQGWSVINSTFFAAIAALTWLAIDPLVKAFYVLRVFYARGRQSGEDLRGELRQIRRWRAREGGARASTAVMTMLLMILAVAAPQKTHAATQDGSAGQTAPVVTSESLDQALDGVLKRREFQWRLRPLPQEISKENEGALRRFMREGVEMIEETIESVRRAWNAFERWLDGLGGKQKPSRSAARSSGNLNTGAARVLLYVLLGALLVVLLVGLVQIFRRRPVSKNAAIAGQAAHVGRPDLQDESTHAAQMPTDGWLALAKEQIEKGDWRLALRALYLATLARYAAEGLLTLAKHKTNLDYERELRRRALLNPERVVPFSGKRRVFESVWYGREIASEVVVREWYAEMAEAPVAS